MLPVTMTQSIGKRYRLEHLIGMGGMGAVYRAVDRLTGKVVALKRVTMNELHLEPSASGAQTDVRVALTQEFKLIASLRHPNVITVLDYGFDQNREPYYTMEYLAGADTLLEASRPQNIVQRVHLLVQTLQALTYLHRRGILHRDLKPANVLVYEGQVKVLDFGLSMMRDRVDRSQRSEESDPAVGTLGYMPPEVLLGDPPREAADLYAVGIMAYEIFAGRHPFHIEDVGLLINDILHTAPDVYQLDISLPLAQVIQRLLMKNPQDRYQNAREVIADLSASVETPIHIETEATRESFLQAARFVGRDHELDQLTHALKVTTTGQGSLWLIGGESGVGKSRLTDELRTRALVQGALVMQGQSENATGIPYQMWRSVIQWLMLLRDLSADEINVIHNLTLEQTPTSPLDPATAQARFLRILKESLASLDQPVLFLVEDLHWAGSESIALLVQLEKMLSTLPLLIVVSYRDDERPDIPQLFPSVPVMKLTRLSERGIAELSQAMLGEVGRQAHVVDLLKRETEGNIFFIIEVIRALADEAGDLEQIGLMTLPEHVFSGGIKRIVQHRLKHIPPYAYQLLYHAAVSGRQLDLTLLKILAPTIDLDRWLTDCANASVLEVADGNQWRFTHDKLREGVIADLSDLERIETHQHVAKAIEQIYGRERVSALAYHWGKAQHIEKELFYTRLAGQQALRSGAYLEAVDYFERTLQLTPENSAAQIDLMQQLGEAHLGFGGYDQARRLYQQSAGLADQFGQTPAKANALARLGDIAHTQNDYKTAESLYTESHRLYQQLGDRQGVAKTLNSLGTLAYDLGEAERAKRLYQESLNLTRESGGQWGMAGAIRKDEAINTRDTQEFRLLLGQLDTQLESGDQLNAAKTLQQLGESAVHVGDIQTAKDYYERSVALYRALNQPIGVIEGYNALANTLLNTPESSHYLLEALQTAQSHQLIPHTLETLLNFAVYFQQRGNLEQSVEILAFILYYPDSSDALQDQAERLAFELEGQFDSSVWERGKNQSFEHLIRQVIQWLSA
ncbi:MAG: AAA family ATPase [Anaerolineae bacterium]|nr:AAA family ATPase [Anaerolineae bacterium]